MILIFTLSADKGQKVRPYNNSTSECDDAAGAQAVGALTSIISTLEVGTMIQEQVYIYKK